jgi:hypothetical protein
MVDSTTVTDADEFVDAIVPRDALDCDEDAARELWRIWTHRYQNGAEDDVLIALPFWLADSEFGKDWPYLFGAVEYDDPDKGAVLFSDCRLINVNIVANGIWDDVTMSETLDVLDLRDRDDEDAFEYDEKGLLWVPRTQMHVFERGDSSSDQTLTGSTLD